MNINNDDIAKVLSKLYSLSKKFDKSRCNQIFKNIFPSNAGRVRSSNHLTD